MSNQTKITDKKTVLSDLALAIRSRELSLLGRREVLTGKAKFGIFGGGKELPQIAMAKFFEKGDFRSGYYRDQTFMMAIGHLTVQQYFAGLYAHTDIEKDPLSAGRQMGGHFTTRNLNEDGSWKNLMEQKNSSSDISCTAGQMPRLLGLALASKIYRENEELHKYTNFTNKGKEVAFGTIGDASTSEGMFWETMNAASVLQVPMVMAVWDDGHGISVPKKYQTTKESISDAMEGFVKGENDKTGIYIYRAKGWDYPGLIDAFEKATKVARETSTPVLVHVDEVTQPQGHSTSGSHERYKTKEYLQWEKEHDCLLKFKEWIIEEKIADSNEIETLHKQIKKEVREEQKAAFKDFDDEIKIELNEVISLIKNIIKTSINSVFVKTILDKLEAIFDATRKDTIASARRVLYTVRNENSSEIDALKNWYKKQQKLNYHRYSDMLYSESEFAATKVKNVAPVFNSEKTLVDGRVILRDNFDKIFETNPLVLTFGEDTGKIGGVNQTMEGMQEKYGEIRVSDTGIRETTIIGQGIGMALRGLRPIAEIQYLDYIYYAFQTLRDDLATTLYRTKGGQKAPLIVRSRGHRLEGIWHAGSPMGAIINSMRGIIVAVPRNMTKAAGFYNLLLQSDEPALVIEPLNGYRTKEELPTNLGEFTTPIGIPEITKEGKDLTLVSYGSTFNICTEAVKELQTMGIDVELIDIQTLLPFDINHTIVESLKKTNKLLIVDEDVPGAASGYILDQILVKQKGYYHLDVEPKTLTAKDHAPAFASDGDYFSKPNKEDIIEAAYEIMTDVNPDSFPEIF